MRRVRRNIQKVGTMRQRRYQAGLTFRIGPPHPPRHRHGNSCRIMSGRRDNGHRGGTADLSRIKPVIVDPNRMHLRPHGPEHIAHRGPTEVFDGGGLAGAKQSAEDDLKRFGGPRGDHDLFRATVQFAPDRQVRADRVPQRVPAQRVRSPEQILMRSPHPHARSICFDQTRWGNRA